MTAMPGTTRDLIEAPVAIGGVAFLLIDTAGLRETGDAIEAIGVDRARLSAAAADILLWLGPPEHKPDGAIAVHPKADICAATPEAELVVSALTGQGLDELARFLVERSGQPVGLEREFAINQRHKTVLAETAEALDGARSTDALVRGEALRLSRLALDRITGRAGVEDMLDALFGRFCIGK